MRRQIIAGNWKMHKTVSEAVQLAKFIRLGTMGITQPEIVVCPPFTALESVYQIIRDSNVKLGAQNVFWEEEGAYTGELSSKMLLTVGCEYVILGHSERRFHFGETDQMVNRKVRSALAAGLIPIICVGERLEDREAGGTETVVERQIRGAYEDLSGEEAVKAVIAYEPVWAIGTGRTATPEQANEVHRFIRGLLSRLYDGRVAGEVRVQYGGSVKPENAGELLRQPDIDGALVGGASLEANSFIQIIKSR